MEPEPNTVYSADFLQKIRLIVDTIPTLAWSADPEGFADFFNQAWLEYTGLSLEQAVEWGWKNAIHPEDLPQNCGGISASREV
jgi:PAS domain S-box-containing protein